MVFLDIDDDGIEFRVLDELDQLVETGNPGRRPCHIDAFDLRSIRIGIDLAGGIEFSGLRVDDLRDDLALFVKLDGCSDELFEGYRTRISPMPSPNMHNKADNNNSILSPPYQFMTSTRAVHPWICTFLYYILGNRKRVGGKRRNLRKFVGLSPKEQFFST